MGVARVCVMALLAALAVGALAAPAAAQATATPEPTATPAYEVYHTLPSGAVMVEVRQWTWGELAIFAALLLLIAVTIIEAVWRTFA